MKLLVFVGIFLFSLLSLSAPNALDRAIKTYSGAKTVELTLEKKVTSTLLSKEKTYHGKIWLSGDLFRFEISKPEESVIVYDGKIIWTMQGSDKNLSTAQVSKFVVPKGSNKGLIISQIFKGDKNQSSFKVLSEKKIGKSVMEVEVQILDPTLAIERMSFLVDSKKSRITKVEYLDEIGNKTELIVKKTELKSGIDKKRYQFLPPKGVNVEEL